MGRWGQPCVHGSGMLKLLDSVGWLWYLPLPSHSPAGRAVSSITAACPHKVYLAGPSPSPQHLWSSRVWLGDHPSPTPNLSVSSLSVTASAQPDSLLGLRLHWLLCPYPSLWPPGREGSESHISSKTWLLSRLCGDWFATVVGVVSTELFLPGCVNTW